jgi:hypothetical protein
MEKKTLSTHSQRKCAQRWEKEGKNNSFVLKERKVG